MSTVNPDIIKQSLEQRVVLNNAARNGLTKPNVVLPTSMLNQLHEWLSSDNNIREKFGLRNNPKITKPVLTCLDVEYLHIETDNTLIAKEIPGFVDKLLEMGYKPTREVLPETKYFKKILELTDVLTTDRYYHQDFNIEFLVVNQKQWDMLLLAKETVNSLIKNSLVKGENYLRAILCVYDSRLKQISKQ